MIRSWQKWITMMADSTKSINRCRRFKDDVEKADSELVANAEGNLLVLACQRLAPLFDYSTQEITDAWSDCTTYEEDRIEAFKAEMESRGMGCIAAAVPPTKAIEDTAKKKKSGRPKRDSILTLLLDTKKTIAWKHFVEKVRSRTDGFVILVFRVNGTKKPWIMTNRGTSGESKSFAGRILIPVKGAPDIHVMPLETYIEENL